MSDIRIDPNTGNPLCIECGHHVGHWAYESKICDKHSKQVIELGRNWINTAEAPR